MVYEELQDVVGRKPPRGAWSTDPRGECACLVCFQFRNTKPTGENHGSLASTFRTAVGVHYRLSLSTLSVMYGRYVQLGTLHRTARQTTRVRSQQEEFTPNRSSPNTNCVWYIKKPLFDHHITPQPPTL